MSQFFSTPVFGVLISVAAYCIGVFIQKKVKKAFCNGLIIAGVLIILFLVLTKTPYESYNVGGQIVNMFLAPATACLAIGIYEKRALLQKNWLPILCGCVVGVLTSLGSIFVMCRLFGLSKELTVSVLPKSVTTPIATAISESHGGIVSITAAVVLCTGILGNLTAPLLAKIFRIKDPTAEGLAIGACSHAIGTGKAIEIGETQGAISGLAVALCGIITAIATMFFL